MSLIPSSNLSQMLTVAINAKLVDVHTCLPGVIEQFDPSTQLCSVQIQIKRKVRNQDNSFDFVPVPLLADVPFMTMNVQHFAITLPVKAGDECLVFFSERDIDNWHDTGRESEPRSARRFDFSDAFAIPAISSVVKKISDYSSDNLEIRSKDNQSKIILKENGNIEVINGTQIDITSPIINLNGNVNVSKTVTVIEDVNVTGDVTAGSVDLKTHVHSGVTSGGSNSGPPV